MKKYTKVKSETEIVIPDGVQRIDDRAFSTAFFLASSAALTRKVCYQCPKCYKPISSENLDQRVFLCPKCNVEMHYVETYDFDTETHKVIKRWKEEDRINYVIPTKPVVTCPYCNSTNTKKISLTVKAVNTALFGILGTKRHKQWHCNKCGSEW